MQSEAPILVHASLFDLDPVDFNGLGASSAYSISCYRANEDW